MWGSEKVCEYRRAAGDPMRTYEELAELAVTCAKQAHITVNKDVARELWRMALGYQQEAAALGDGELPDIGEKPQHF
jgi:hypothetical protein